MRNWSEMRLSLFGKKKIAPEFLILAKVERGLDEYSTLKKGDFNIQQLFNDCVLNDFCLKGYKVIEILPVEGVIKNYHSWLYKANGGNYGICISTKTEDGKRIVPDLVARKKEPSATLLNFISIIAHELGHIALEHRLSDLQELRPSELFPSMGPEHEWEAWIFSELIRAFILADYSVKTKKSLNKDGAPELFL